MCWKRALCVYVDTGLSGLECVVIFIGDIDYGVGDLDGYGV